MKKTVLALVLLMSSFGLHANAADYQCRNTLGCTAMISENGQLKTVNFRKGDIVCTEDGWIVSTEDGWKKLKPKRKVNNPAECLSGDCYATNMMNGQAELFHDGDIISLDFYAPIAGNWGKERLPNELCLQGL